MKRLPSFARIGGTAAVAIGLALVTGVGTAHAEGNTVDYFSSGGKKRAMVIFEPRNSSGGPEIVTVDDRSKDGHYIYAEVYDATSGGKKGTCETSSYKACEVNVKDGHKVRINVYRLNSRDSDFMGEVHTRAGKLPTA
ncbi:hypothetical protein [Streptomyces cucumeris]|uniref:hypothetical protein n=1 Tax=Streptomyces cucumeris TaxID=2962890 RepID=UPI003D72515B